MTLFEYYDSYQNPYKPLFRSLNHISSKILRRAWTHWLKLKISIDLNFSAEDTLDLAMFKLPFARSEKLRIICDHILTIKESRQNFPRVILSI